MRIKTSSWFETTIKCKKTTEDGFERMVSETYAVDVLSFTEAEEKTIEEIASAIAGECEVKAIKKAGYSEVIFSDGANDSLFYKAKVKFITLNERTGKETSTTTTYLVQGATLEGAVANISKAMHDTLGDWHLAAIAETNILDVFEHNDTRQK